MIGVHTSKFILGTVPMILVIMAGCSSERSEKTDGNLRDVVRELPGLRTEVENTDMSDDQALATATFGGGCFWCTEAVFQRLEGVENVVSGFMGGHVKDPTYEQVCSKTTGHAEVIHFNFDPAKTSYAELLEVFWKTHDPTTLNRQGNDEGPQYRSAVFFHSEEQKELAEKFKAKLDSVGAFENSIVTEITEASDFYPAVSKHQNYFNLNPKAGYCNFIIRPKLEKLEQAFADKLKMEQ